MLTTGLHLLVLASTCTGVSRRMRLTAEAQLPDRWVVVYLSIDIDNNLTWISTRVHLVEKYHRRPKVKVMILSMLHL